MEAQTQPLAVSAGLPGWLVVLVAAAVACGVFVLLFRARSLKLPLLLLVIVGALVVGYALLLSYVRETAQQARRAAVEAIAVRASALDAALVSSGLACLDAPDGAEESCEAVVFATPASVAAARALVRARLQLVADSVALPDGAASTAGDPLAGWRAGLRRDVYGLVAQVLTADFACGKDGCGVAQALGIGAPDPARFESLVAEHQKIWSAPPEAPPPLPSPPAAPSPEPSAAPQEPVTAEPAPAAAPAQSPPTPSPPAPSTPARTPDAATESAPAAAPEPPPAVAAAPAEPEPPVPTLDAPLPPARPAIPPRSVVRRPSPPPAEPAPDAAPAAQ